MTCKNCGTENILSAAFCKRCGSPFSEQERTDAYNATVCGKIDRVIAAKQIATLEVVTGNPFFRAAVLVVILAVGIFLTAKNGNAFTIRRGAAYDVAYNTRLDEYYVTSEDERFPVELYVPRKAEGITVITLDSENETTDTRTYGADGEIVLYAGAAHHYILRAEYPDGADELRVFALRAAP